MGAYIIRRILYAIPVLLGVNILTFVLFFTVNSPNDIAYVHLGTKYVTKQQIEHGYAMPLFYNEKTKSITDTIFWQKTMRLFIFDFGVADSGKSINQAIA